MKVAKSSAKLASNRNKLENCVKSQWTNGEREANCHSIKIVFERYKKVAENRWKLLNFAMRFSFQFESRFVLPIANVSVSLVSALAVSVSVSLAVDVSASCHRIGSWQLRGPPAKRSKDTAAVWRSAQTDWTKHFSPRFHSLYLSLFHSPPLSLFHIPSPWATNFLVSLLMFVYNLCFFLLFLKIIILFWISLDSSINYPNTQTTFLIGNKN